MRKKKSCVQRSYFVHRTPRLLRAFSVARKRALPSTAMVASAIKGKAHWAKLRPENTCTTYVSLRFLLRQMATLKTRRIHAEFLTTCGNGRAQEGFRDRYMGG